MTVALGVESDPEGVVGLYRRHARAWAADRAGWFFEAAWLEQFATMVPAGGSVLDIGCGAGEPMARALMARGGAVVGVDAAPEMIALCMAALPDAAWQVADMRTLALGRRFDGLLAWDSLFHLTPADQRLMFAIFRAHAAAGAALMFSSGTSLGEAIGRYGGGRLYHGSLDPAEYRALMAANGFEVMAHVVADPGCGGRTVWLARSVDLA